MKHFVFLSLVPYLLTIGSLSAQKQSESIVERLPASTVILVDVPNPPDLIKELLEHPIRKKVESIPDVAAFLNGPQMKVAAGVIAFAELQLGTDWKTAVSQLSGKGLSIGFDAETEAMFLLLHASDAGMLEKTFNTLITLANNEGNLKSSIYRGYTGYQIDKNVVARFDDALLITTKGELATKLVDLKLDKTGDRLAGQASFQQALGVRKPGLGWGWVNTRVLREAGVAKELFSGKTENMLAELLLGGVLQTLTEADWATGQFSLSHHDFSLEFAIPAASSNLPPHRSWYQSTAKNVQRVQPVGQELMVLTMQRDLSDFWLASSELYGERTNAKISESDTNLSNLFAGRDFGSDILAMLESDVQLVLDRQFETGTGPAVKLPGFALVGRFRDPEAGAQQLKLSFQNLIAFGNLTSAQENRPPFEMDVDLVGKHKLHFANVMSQESFAKMNKGATINQGDMIYNFSPAVGFKDDLVIMSSTRGLASKLMMRDLRPLNQKESGHFSLSLDLQVLRDVLNDNRTQMVADAMLKKGKTKAQAETETDFVLQALGWFDEAWMQLATEEKQMKLKVSLELQPASHP